MKFPPLKTTALGLGLLLFLSVPWARGQQQASIPPAVVDQGKAGDLLGVDKIWTFHLQFSAKAWEEIQPKGGSKFGMFLGGPKGPGQKEPAKPGQNQPSKGKGLYGIDFQYVPATIEMQGKTYKDVGVRFKGNSTYVSAPRGIKKPFKFDFNRYVKDQRFFGLTMVVMGNNAFDPSQIREALSYYVFREAGVPAPRTAFVKIYLTVPGKYDREYLGLYTLIENVNGTFLKDRFQTKKGMLLKPEGIQGLTYLGEDWKPYEDKYRPDNEPSKKEKDRLKEFTKLVNGFDDAMFRKKIDDYMDVDQFLRFMAANTLLSNFDSFFGTGHNYFLYLHPKTNKFLFIPYDLNMSFGGFALGGSPEQLMDLSIRKPFLGKNRLGERLLAIKEYDAAYRVHLKNLTEKTFNPEKMAAVIEVMNQTIKEAIAEEAKLTNKGSGFSFNIFGNLKMPDLKTFISRRTESVTAQLAGKSQGKELGGFGFGFGGPKPGQPGKGKFGPGSFVAKPAFAAADASGDGKLSMKEAETALKKFFQECDKDKKGMIDEKMLAEGINRLMPRSPGFGGPKPGAPAAFGPGNFWAKPILKKIGSKDNQVSEKDLLATAIPLFKEWDKDESGTLTETEFADGLSQLFAAPGAGPGNRPFGPPASGPGIPGGIPSPAPKKGGP